MELISSSNCVCDFSSVVRFKRKFWWFGVDVLEPYFMNFFCIFMPAIFHYHFLPPHFHSSNAMESQIYGQMGSYNLCQQLERTFLEWRDSTNTVCRKQAKYSLMVISEESST